MHRCRHDEGDIERHLVDAIRVNFAILGASGESAIAVTIPLEVSAAQPAARRSGFRVSWSTPETSDPGSGRSIASSGVPGCGASTVETGSTALAITVFDV